MPAKWARGRGRIRRGVGVCWSLVRSRVEGSRVEGGVSVHWKKAFWNWLLDSGLAQLLFSKAPWLTVTRIFKADGPSLDTGLRTGLVHVLGQV